MTRHFRNMTRVTAAAGAAFLLASAPPALADTSQNAEAPAMTEGEERLAELLEGRVAGEPQNCIRQLLTERMTTIEGTAYVYGSGNTIYVQRTQDPDDIDDRDALVVRRFSGSQLCRQDIVTTIDPQLGFFTGAVFFDEFVPYTKVDDEG